VGKCCHFRKTTIESSHEISLELSIGHIKWYAIEYCSSLALESEAAEGVGAKSFESNAHSGYFEQNWVNLRSGIIQIVTTNETAKCKIAKMNGLRNRIEKRTFNLDFWI